jgi:hypothetical protein
MPPALGAGGVVAGAGAAGADGVTGTLNAGDETSGPRGIQPTGPGMLASIGVVGGAPAGDGASKLSIGKAGDGGK